MLQINISDRFLEEKKYIIRVFFDVFLGLKYKINISASNRNYYEISMPNNKKIIFEDSFWANIKDSYLKEEHIPLKVYFSTNQFVSETNIPIIYGNNRFEVTNNSVICGIDIFASSFFMLTRWEEYTNKTRDQYNRFPATASLAYINGFLDRPIVNEYVEMLWNMLKHLGYQKERKQHKFEMLLTHDVDFPFKYSSWKSGIGYIGRNTLIRHNLKPAVESLLSKIKSHIDCKKDPYNTFGFLMDQSEKLGLKSHFFFIGGGLTQYEENYDLQNKKIQSIVKEIQARGHVIGFHPSYNAYNNPELWKSEKDNLEKNINTDVKIGREHYLRFEVPYTWQIWEDNNMEWDSTLTYADQEGFRCGTCWEYPVFNFLTKQQLKLNEKPLIVMDTTLFSYQKDLFLESIKNKVIALLNKCKKYNGTFVYLWHNSNLVEDEKKKVFLETINL